jgi:hypothetical protein
MYISLCLEFYAIKKFRGSIKSPGFPFVRQSVRPYVRTSRIRVRPITALFKVGFYNYFTGKDKHIESTCRAQNLGRYLEGQGV